MISDRLKEFVLLASDPKLSELKYEIIKPDAPVPDWEKEAGMAVAWDRYVLVVANVGDDVLPANEVKINGTVLTKDTRLSELMKAVDKGQ